MPRGVGCSRGVPARLACLLLLALIAVVCLATGADAKKRPQACPTNTDGTPACNGCVKKNCKFDDRCFFDKAGANSPTSPNAVCQTAATKVDPDVCRGIQRRHGKNARSFIPNKRARCQAASSPQNNGTSVPCGCMNRNLRPAKKRCKFCVPVSPLTPCVNGPDCPKDPGIGGDTPPPPAPPSPPSPPSPPAPPPPTNTTDFLAGNLMTMQGGAVKYTPRNNNGNWTTLCQIPQQAKAIDVGASQTVSSVVTPDSAYILSVWTGQVPVPGLADLYADKPKSYNAKVLNTPDYMGGTTYFDNAKAWYTGGLPKTSTGASTGGLAPAGYTGNGGDYLDNYFRSAIQSPAGTKALSGSSSGEANSQIFKKTSAYWVAVTHVMYNLDMAAKNIAANNTAAANANFDSVAAAYFGCGDTNPVPLPSFGGVQITYGTTVASPDTGFNATTMSVYGVANKRADNYGTLGLVSTDGATCTAASTTCKQVAKINVEVGAALTAGPTADNIATIRDATLTIFTQAAQRYVAKLTLAAQLPGDGMGGSTFINQATSTTRLAAGSFIPSTIAGATTGGGSDKLMQTACGQKASYVSVTARTETSGNTDGTAGITTANQVSGVNSCGVSANVGVKGTPVSNTATFGSVMAELSTAPTSFTANAAATAGTAPYILPTLAYTNNAGGSTQGGATTANILKATRGFGPSAGNPPASAPPVACIGSTVQFAGVVNNGAADGGTAVANAKHAMALCDPNGRLPPDEVLAATTLANRVAAYTVNTNGVKVSITSVWDPVTAALLTNGAPCCAALIYGNEGLGISTSGAPAASLIKAPSTFVPPIVGGDMSATASPGGMCPVSGTDIVGVQGYASPTEVNLLEGQAFYAVMAPMQYTIQKTSTNTNTQSTNASKQKTCAETLTKMMKVAQTPATTATNAAGCANPNGGTAIALSDAAANCRGSDVNAIDYPMWKVKIGQTAAGSGGLDYFVPNGYCYANACFEDFADVGLTSAYKGKTKLAALVKSPDMSSNPTTVGTAPSATGACGRANKACAAAPTGWTGAAAVFEGCPSTTVTGGNTACTTLQIEGQTGRIPTA